MLSNAVSMFIQKFNLVTYLGGTTCILLGCYSFLKGTVLYLWYVKFCFKFHLYRYEGRWWDSLEHQFTFSRFFIATFSSAFYVDITKILS